MNRIKEMWVALLIKLMKRQGYVVMTRETHGFIVSQARALADRAENRDGRAWRHTVINRASVLVTMLERGLS